MGGGYWIDSTVLLTDNKIFNYIDKQPLFAFSYWYYGFQPEILTFNNWFLHSTTNNNILCLVRAFLHEYWKDYNRLVHYFVFQIFTTIACEYYHDEYKKIPIISQVDSHVLAEYLFDEYDEDKFNLIKHITGIHKLSYKYDFSKNHSDSIYNRVIFQN